MIHRTHLKAIRDNYDANFSGMTNVTNIFSELTNEVLKQESKIDVLNVLLKRLTDLEGNAPFKFEFAVINIIDPYKKKVNEWKFSEKINPELNHHLWRSDEADDDIKDLPENDIILVVYNQKCVIKLQDQSYKILIGDVPIDQEVILDERLFKKYEHHKLTRYYFPLININTNGDIFTFGVVEMGYITKSINFQFDDSYIYSIKSYIDNCIKIYHKLYLDEEINYLQKKIIIPSQSTEESHESFLGHILSDIAKEYSIYKLEVDIISYNQNEENWIPDDVESKRVNIEDSDIVKTRQVTTQNKHKGIYRIVYNSQVPYYAPNVDEDENFIPGYNGVRSQYSIPFSVGDRKIGVCSFYSEHINYFDKFKQEILRIFTNEVADKYLRKKTNYQLSKLVLPLNIYGSKEQIFYSTIESFMGYLPSAGICIYEFNFEKTSRKFTTTINKYFLSLNKYICEEYNKSLQVEKFLKLELCIDSNDLDGNLCGSVINIPIFYGREDPYGFIQITSRKKISRIYEDDKVFFLQAASKLAITLYSVDFFQNFIKLPTVLLEGNTSDIYVQLQRWAEDFFNADPVLIFKYNYTHEYNLSMVTSDHKLINKLSKKAAQNEPDSYNMVNIVLENGDLYIPNSYIYNSKYNHKSRNWVSSEFKEDFWHREQIKSCAAIRLEANKEILGALFINSRTKEYPAGFSTEFKNTLKTFAVLASQAIEYTRFWELRNSLVNQNRKIQKTIIEGMVVNSFSHSLENTTLAIDRTIQDVFKILSSTEIPSELKKGKYEGPELLHKFKEYLTAKLLNLKSPLRIQVDTLERFRNFRKTNTEGYLFTNNSVNSLIDDSIKLAKSRLENAGITIDLKGMRDKKDMKIIFDYNSLQHVLLNLIYNSVDSITDAPKTNRRVIRVYLENSVISKSDGNVAISISDSGPGLKDEFKRRLFQPYETTKPYGTGIGLFLCKEIVERVHHGQIEYSEQLSNDGKWTTFKVILPYEIN